MFIKLLLLHHMILQCHYSLSLKKRKIKRLSCMTSAQELRNSADFCTGELMQFITL